MKKSPKLQSKPKQRNKPVPKSGDFTLSKGEKPYKPRTKDEQMLVDLMRQMD